MSTEVTLNKKEEKVKPKLLSKHTSTELMHLWCNRMINKEIKKGNYEFTYDNFYVNNKLKAYYIDDKNVVLEKFDNRGSFSNGSSSWDIARYFGDRVNLIIVNKLPIQDNEVSEQGKISWLKNEWEIDNQRIFDRIAMYKEVANNNRMFTCDDAITSSNMLYYITDDKKYDFYGKRIKNEFFKLQLEQKATYTHYNGWGSRGEIKQSFIVKYTIEGLANLKPEDFFSKEEIDLIEMKAWINKYGKCYTQKPHTRWNKEIVYSTEFCGYAKTLKEYKVIWFSDKREEYCRQVEHLKEEEVKRNKLKELKARQEEVKLALLKIDNFRSNSGSTSNLNILNYVLLRYSGGIIISSMGVKISIEEAKKALQLFRIKETKHDLVQGFTYTGIIKRNIPYLDEQQEVQYREEDCIKVGCHVCPESEIKAFLEYYKLDW